MELAWGAGDVLLFTVVEWLQWCRTPLIPAFKRKRQADLLVGGQPGVQSEFQDSRRKTKNKTKHKKQKTQQQHKQRRGGAGDKIKSKRRTDRLEKLVHQHRLPYAQDTESPSSSLLAALKGSPHPSEGKTLQPALRALRPSRSPHLTVPPRSG